jgi:hypothetical protein
MLAVPKRHGSSMMVTVTTMTVIALVMLSMPAESVANTRSEEEAVTVRIGVIVSNGRAKRAGNGDGHDATVYPYDVPLSVS